MDPGDMHPYLLLSNESIHVNYTAAQLFLFHSCAPATEITVPILCEKQLSKNNNESFA